MVICFLIQRWAKPWEWSNSFAWINECGKLLASPIFLSYSPASLSVIWKGHVQGCQASCPSLQPMHTHTHLADKWGCLSIIDKIAARQPTSKSRRCLRRQEAWGPHRASSCMHGSVTRAVNCPSLVCFMGITQPRRNGGRRFIQPQGYSKEGRPNLGLQRFLMTTRNISTEMQRK